MIAMISTLIEKGYAYEKNGTVYFRTRKFKNYGQLSKKNLDDMRAGIRIAVSDEKEDAMDFVLWKPKKEGRTSMGISLGRRPSGLAYRMFRDV